MAKKRRLQIDISESLAQAIGCVCEDLCVSKSKIVQLSCIAYLRAYCQQNEEKANKSLLDLIAESETYLVD